MKLAVIFEIPDEQAADYAAMARQLIDHHRFAAANDLPVWSFNTHMRPIAASMDEDSTVAIAELRQALADEDMDALHSEAIRENWARMQVAAAGKSWDTHVAKFSGAVVPR